MSPEHLTHSSPFGKHFFLRPILPNVVSTQQFPQEMEFTENVNTVPMKRLVFKKGGVLKGQKGLWDLSKELVSGIDLSKLGQKDYKIGEDGLLDTGLDIAGMARRSATPETKSAITSPTPVTTNYATDHTYGSGNETKATKQVGDY